MAMKGTMLVAIVAIVVIIVLTSVFIYVGLPTNTGGTTTSIVSVPPETGGLAYMINFAYEENPILAGQTQWINITMTQGAYAAIDVPGDLYVTAPNQTSYYQIFQFTTDANGAAEFPFTIAQNATVGTYNVNVIIGSLGQIIQNVSSSFSVAN